MKKALRWVVLLSAVTLGLVAFGAMRSEADWYAYVWMVLGVVGCLVGVWAYDRSREWWDRVCAQQEDTLALQRRVKEIQRSVDRSLAQKEARRES